MTNEHKARQVDCLEARIGSFEWSLSEGRISAHTAERAIARIKVQIEELQA